MGAGAAPEQVAAVLRERIYGAIACLSTLLVLVRHGEPDSTPWVAFVDVAVENEREDGHHRVDCGVADKEPVTVERDGLES